MELIVSLLVITAIILGSFLSIHNHEKQKSSTIQRMMSVYEDNCKDHCSTTRQITEQFMKVSSEQVISIKELHKRTLEILSGEKLDV